MSTSKRYAMPSKPTLLACAMASCLALSAPLVFAQSTGATVRGQTTGGVEITATNTETGLVRRATATSDGSYTLAGIPPGTYTIQAAGGAPRTVTLSVAQTATLNLEAAGAAATTTLEGVTVTANMLPEVKTSEVGATVSNKIISTVPRITRNFLEFADVVPGVAFSLDPGNGTTKLQGGAQSANAINVYIDGVGQKNYVLQGGITGQDSSRGNPFPELGIGEYKVITQNYKAEYDQVSSAAVTAVTKSGTNEFHGEVFGTYTGDSWRAMTPSEANAGDKTQTHEKEYGLALGGPIIQDKMHFFFTYEGKDFVTPTAVLIGTPLPAPLPADVTAQAGPTTLPFHEDLYFGKIDWSFSDQDLVELTAKYRDETQRDNVGGSQAPSFGSDIINNEKRADLRWQHTADRWLNDAHITYEDTEWGPQPLNNGIAQVYAVQADNNRVLLQTGAGANFQNKGQKGPSFQDDFTFTDLHWMGDHLVKTGIKYKQVDLNTQEINPANPQFFYNVDANGADSVPYKAFFGVPLAGIGNGTAESSNKQFGIYLQDDWQVNEKLTLNLGVRWDYEETPSYLDYVTPQAVVDALHGWSNINLPNSGINIDDYISNGNNRDAQKDQWQPRLGFSYDLNADQQHVIFGGVGRSYDRNSFDYLQLETSKATFPSYEVFFNSPDGSPCDTTQSNCVNWDPSFYNINNLRALVSPTGGGREIDLLANNLKVPYSDQASLGMRNEVDLWNTSWNTSATLSRIVSKDGFAFVLGNRRPDGSFWGTGENNDYGQPWGFPIPGYGALILGKNGIESKANSLLLSADKPYTPDSGWGVTIAYTYTDADENRKFNEHYALDEPDITDYPTLMSSGVSKHRLVATGILDGPSGWTFSSKLTLATPKPISEIACFGAASHCIPVAVSAPASGRFLAGGKIFGTRSLDFAISKDFDMTAGIVLYVRGDLINALNFKNYSDYNNNWGTNGVYNPTPTLNTIGNMFTVPRTVKLTMGVRW
jgi:outer membrane receptor protein involved in Fe transport